MNTTCIGLGAVFFMLYVFLTTLGYTYLGLICCIISIFANIIGML